MRLEDQEDQIRKKIKGDKNRGKIKEAHEVLAEGKNKKDFKTLRDETKDMLKGEFKLP